MQCHPGLGVSAPGVPRWRRESCDHIQSGTTGTSEDGAEQRPTLEAAVNNMAGIFRKE